MKTDNIVGSFGSCGSLRGIEWIRNRVVPVLIWHSSIWLKLGRSELQKGDDGLWMISGISAYLIEIESQCLTQ